MKTISSKYKYIIALDLTLADTAISYPISLKSVTAILNSSVVNILPNDLQVIVLASTVAAFPISFFVEYKIVSFLDKKIRAFLRK